MWFLALAVLLFLGMGVITSQVENRESRRGQPPRRTDAERARDKERERQDSIEQARITAANAAGAKAYRERWGSMSSRLP